MVRVLYGGEPVSTVAGGAACSAILQHRVNQKAVYGVGDLLYLPLIGVFITGFVIFGVDEGVQVAVVVVAVCGEIEGKLDVGGGLFLEDGDYSVQSVVTLGALDRYVGVVGVGQLELGGVAVLVVGGVGELYIVRCGDDL
jgi:hypothetical protein